jgi:hypothetical protein
MPELKSRREATTPGVEAVSRPIPGHIWLAAVYPAAARVGYESHFATPAGAVDTLFGEREVSGAGRHERAVAQALGLRGKRRGEEISPKRSSG